MPMSNAFESLFRLKSHWEWAYSGISLNQDPDTIFRSRKLKPSSSIPSVLFVCMGNICRSPAAEAIWQYKVKAVAGSTDFDCDSAGTISYHAGEKADHRMRQALANRGYFSASTARQIQSSDIHRFDHILAMDRSNVEMIYQMFGPDPLLQSKLHLFCDFAGMHNRRDIPDPYYGGLNGFCMVIDLLETGCDHIMEKLKIGPASH